MVPPEPRPPAVIWAVWAPHRACLLQDPVPLPAQPAPACRWEPRTAQRQGETSSGMGAGHVRPAHVSSPLCSSHWGDRMHLIATLWLGEVTLASLWGLWRATPGRWPCLRPCPSSKGAVLPSSLPRVLPASSTQFLSHAVFRTLNPIVLWFKSLFISHSSKLLGKEQLWRFYFIMKTRHPVFCAVF